MAFTCNLLMVTTSRSASAPPLRRRPRLLQIQSPRSGARRTCLCQLRRPHSSSSGSTTGGIPLHGKSGVGPLRPSAVPYPSASLLEEKSSEDVVRTDADVCSHGGGHGGSRGGGGESAKAGGGDRGDEDDASMELQVRPLPNRKPEKVVVPESLVVSVLEILNVLSGNAAATVLASLQKNPAIRFLVAPFSEVTVLRGVLITDKRSDVDPSFSECCSTTSTVVNNQVGDESSYSTDNDIGEPASQNSRNAYLLEMVPVTLKDKRSDVDPSFSECCSTTSTVVNNQVGDETSYSSDNDIGEPTSRNNRNAYLLEIVPVNMNHSEITINVHDQNDTTNNRHPSTAPLLNNTPINSPEVNKKGFLGFLYTLVWTLFALYSALFTLSVTYPSSAKALVSFDEAWTRHICLINLVSCLGSAVMLPFASRFKGDKSTNDNDGFGYFIWALYFLLLALISEYFLTLHVYLHIPKLTVWSFGTAIFSFVLIVLPIVRYIEGQRPTLASIWAKYWEKLKCCRRRPTPFAPSERLV